MKTDPSIIYMVPEHNLFLQMRYWEGQVYYYVKIRISLLGFMEIRWKVDGEVSGFEYSFVGYTIKGYSGQYYVQVKALIQLTVDTLQDRHTAAKKFIIQSDNASGFASQELIPFIFSINTRLDDEKNVVLSIWIFTESHTGKTQLDTHY